VVVAPHFLYIVQEVDAPSIEVSDIWPCPGSPDGQHDPIGIPPAIAHRLGAAPGQRGCLYCDALV
jgi:hypothetical protein